ncbi:mCG119911 [Mus musculus]|nr:mCG119911 [Mus musculus]
MASSTVAKKEQRLPKVAQVKNKAAAEVQITAEQLLREAKERELELLAPPPQQKITDAEEFNDYKLRRRKAFEENLRQKRTVISNWIKYAQWEESLKELDRARSIYERALDVDYRKCPKNKLFKGYIALELQLREFDRCRKLYEKFLEFGPENCTSWIKFAELETILGDVERARAIYELAISQPRLDMPELLWKSYIDFEMEQEEPERTRNLYRRLLQRTQHVKVWISLAQFEFSSGKEGSVAKCRQIYQEANRSMRHCQDKEERLMLLESWRSFEGEFGTVADKERVDRLMPDEVKKRRKVQADDGSDAGWQEYRDYIFPEDAAQQPNLKLSGRGQAVEETATGKRSCRTGSR